MHASDWQKSSFSNEAAACIELTVIDHAPRVREGDEPDVIVTTTSHRLRELINSVKTGRFDRLGTGAGDVS